jgi:hypothetical protein
MFALRRSGHMRLEAFVEKDFIGLDLIPEDLEDKKFCRGINLAFGAGDLHMCIEESCLVIGYDGEKRSFIIKKKECEVIDKSLNAVLAGTARFFIGSTLIVDDFSEPYCICIIRLLGKAKEEIKDSQCKLVRSYIPPLLPIERDRSSYQKGKISIQKKLTNELFFDSFFRRPLFKVGKIKPTKQQKII